MEETKSKVDLKLQKGCCTLGVRLKGMIGPFRRAIALEYGESWGGPIVGVAQCSSCACCYKYVCLGFNDVVRVYSIAQVPTNSLGVLEQAYSKVNKPSWPIWVPPTESQIREKDRPVFAQLEETVLSRASNPSFVFSTKHLINGRVLETASWDDSTRDWLLKLGVR